MNIFHFLVSLGTITESLARELEVLEAKHGCHKVLKDGEFNAASTAFLNLVNMPLREGKNSFSSSNPKRSGSLWLSYAKIIAECTCRWLEYMYNTLFN